MSGIDPRITEFIESVRASVQADGGDLELTSVADGVAHVKYTIKTGACRECLLPPQYLSDLLMRNFRKWSTEIRAVKIVLEDNEGGSSALGGACPV